MNWQLFSTVGYISVGLWLLVPVLWALHLMIRPRRWLGHVALLAAVAALATAKANSATYVARIQVDMSEQVQQQMDRQAMARKAAEKDRADEVANIRFAEDASRDFLDIAGLDDTDRAYFESFAGNEDAQWKKQKKQRSDGGTAPDDLESLIGASQERTGVQVSEELEQAPEAEPIFMSDKDKTMADRLDGANLQASRLVLILAAVFVLFDYVRRLNNSREAYFPLPVPSSWADALTDRQIVTNLSKRSASALVAKLKHIVRRGETFVLLTDDAQVAKAASMPMPRLPVGFPKHHVIDVAAEPKLDDGFVFETAWFGRNSFVVLENARAHGMLDLFMKLMENRRGSRAHTRRTVHLVWDIADPIPEVTRQRFESLGLATGLTLLICDKPMPVGADA